MAAARPADIVLYVKNLAETIRAAQGQGADCSSPRRQVWDDTCAGQHLHRRLPAAHPRLVRPRAVKGYLATLKAVAASSARKPFTFLWSELGAQSAAGGRALTATYGGIAFPPAVVAVNLKKERVVLMTGAFSEERHQQVHLWHRERSGEAGRSWTSTGKRGHGGRRGTGRTRSRTRPRRRRTNCEQGGERDPVMTEWCAEVRSAAQCEQCSGDGCQLVTTASSYTRFCCSAPFLSLRLLLPAGMKTRTSPFIYLHCSRGGADTGCPLHHPRLTAR